MTAKIIVGFRTRTISDELLEPLIPTIEADKRLSDPDKIAADLTARKAAFKAEAKDMPYLGTFDAVSMADPKNERTATWDYTDRQPGGKKSPICVAVAKWILKGYPQAWSADTHDGKKPDVIFMGFNPRLFIKMLGIECSLPENGLALPPKMWYSNSDHRDIEEAIVPSGFKKLTLDMAIKRRRPTNEKSAAKWDKAMANWKQPHVDPAADMWLIAELATQLGFLAP